MTSSTSSGTEVPCSRGAPATRRALLGACLAGALGAVPARAHTPYRQWQVYRQRHLLIGASREDAGSYPKAKAIQAFLAAHLPEASARVARARTLRRLADLVATDQLRVVLLSLADADALTRGDPPFALAVPDLRALARFGGHVLCARSTFPDAHAWILAWTFIDHDRFESTNGIAIPLHHGVQLAQRGEPKPALPEGAGAAPPGEAAAPHAH